MGANTPPPQSASSGIVSIRKYSLGQVVGVSLHEMFAWQRRRARAHGSADPTAVPSRYSVLKSIRCFVNSDSIAAAQILFAGKSGPECVPN